MEGSESTWFSEQHKNGKFRDLTKSGEISSSVNINLPVIKLYLCQQIARISSREMSGIAICNLHKKYPYIQFSFLLSTVKAMLFHDRRLQ